MIPAVALEFRTHARLADIPQPQWDALLTGDGAATPFQEWTWLEALERARCVGGSSGWHAQHLALWRGDQLIAAAPAYLKDHSEGEFVFDFAWAGAAQRAGIRYYPKLVLAVPFTPCQGRRILVAPGEDRGACERLLLQHAVEHARKARLSSVHVLFPTEGEAATLDAAGFGMRLGVQFHWNNQGYGSYDEFLARFDSKRRNQLRRERRAAEDQGIVLSTRRATDLSALDCETVFRLYGSTVDKFRWGRRYLHREFFALVLSRFASRVELVEARLGGRVVAGAFNVSSATHLYGRYWGCFEEHPFLHFNVCYYHSIAECIARGVQRFEGGAGGEHKLSRGFEPALTHSAHWIFEPALDHAVRDFLGRERAAVRRELPAIQAAAGLKPAPTRPRANEV